MKTVNLSGENLTLEDVINVAYNNYKVSATEEAKEKINKSRAVVDGIVERNDTKYGITTGFGKFSDVTISGEECKTLQKNLIMSHSCGAGRKFPKEVVRIIMLLKNTTSYQKNTNRCKQELQRTMTVEGRFKNGLD